MNDWKGGKEGEKKGGGKAKEGKGKGGRRGREGRMEGERKAGSPFQSKGRYSADEKCEYS